MVVEKRTLKYRLHSEPSEREARTTCERPEKKNLVPQGKHQSPTLCSSELASECSSGSAFESASECSFGSGFDFAFEPAFGCSSGFASDFAFGSAFGSAFEFEPGFVSNFEIGYSESFGMNYQEKLRWIHLDSANIGCCSPVSC